MSVAIAHTGYDVFGGGEALAEELARTFDAPLYVGHGGMHCATDDGVVIHIHDVPDAELEHAHEEAAA